MLLDGRRDTTMSDLIHRVIWHLRKYQRIHISKFVERYILEELEEDFFPYGFCDFDEDSIIDYVYEFVNRVNAGEINICIPLEERISERYETLKEDYLRLLAETDKMTYRCPDEHHDDDMPF
jgi:hypothetical protein